MTQPPQQLRPLLWVRLIFPAVLMVVGAQDLGEALLQRGWEHPGYLVAAALFFAITWVIGAALLSTMNRTEFTVDGDQLLVRKGGATVLKVAAAGARLELDRRNLRLVDSKGGVLFTSARFLWSQKGVRAFAAATGLGLIDHSSATG